MPLVNWQDEYQSALLTAHNALIPAIQTDSGRTDVETAQVIIGMARYAGEIRQGLAAGLLPPNTVDVPLLRAPWHDEHPGSEIPRCSCTHPIAGHEETGCIYAGCGCLKFFGEGPTGDGDADLAATATMPAPPIGSRAPQVCTTCGMPVQWKPARWQGIPGRSRDAHWDHVKTLSWGADHAVTMEE